MPYSASKGPKVRALLQSLACGRSHFCLGPPKFFRLFFTPTDKMLTQLPSCWALALRPGLLLQRGTSGTFCGGQPPGCRSPPRPCNVPYQGMQWG